MTNKQVNVTVKGRNELSQPFGKAEKSIVSLNRTVKTTIAAAGTYFGVRAVLNATKSLAFTTSDAIETNSKFKAVYKEQAAAALKSAKAIAKIGRSVYEVKGFMAGLQDTFVPMDFARDKATELSATLVKLGYDVAAFGNHEDSDVVRDFGSAITGSHEVLKKYGVIINQTVLSQELLRMGIEGGANSATEQQKALARLNLILAGTSDAHGAAAREAAGFSSQYKKAKNKLYDMAVTTGTIVLPTLNKMLTAFNDLSSETVIHTARMISWAGAVVAGMAVGPKVVSVILSIVRVVKSLIAGQITLSALMGPAGWANIAAGMTIATAAIIGSEYALSKFNKQLEETDQKIVDTVKTAAGLGQNGNSSTIPSVSSSSKSALPQGWEQGMFLPGAESHEDKVRNVANAYRSLKETIAQLTTTQDQYLVNQAKEAGYQNAMITRIKMLQEQKNKLEKEQKVKDTYKDAIDNLQTQIATKGMNQSQLQLYNLKKAGLSKDQLANIARLQLQLNGGDKMMANSGGNTLESRFLSGGKVDKTESNTGKLVQLTEKMVKLTEKALPKQYPSTQSLNIAVGDTV